MNGLTLFAATVAEGGTSGFDIGSFTSDLASQAGAAIGTVATGLAPVLIIGVVVGIAFKYFKKFGKG